MYKQEQWPYLTIDKLGKAKKKKNEKKITGWGGGVMTGEFSHSPFLLT